jgi:hypothetical protein
MVCVYVCVEFHWHGVLIGVPGGVTNLIKSVTRQALADRPSHMAGHGARPHQLSASDS